MMIEHPLIQTIEGWAGNATNPRVAFAPNEGFQKQIDLAVLRDATMADEYAKAQAWRTYHNSAALAIALNGRHFGLELHRMTYLSAFGSPLGFALCDAAGYAFGLDINEGTKFFPAFAVSLRLDGFISALEAWAGHFKYGRPFDGAESLPYVLREIVDPNKPGAKFWHQACADGFAEYPEFRTADAKEQANIDDAKRKREKRPTNRKPAEYKDLLAWGWVPLSLWARSSAAISFLLKPDTINAPEAEKRVQRDISVLGFSASHHGKHQDSIDRASGL